MDPRVATVDRIQLAAHLVIRLFTAFVLIYGTQDNVFSHERMLEFRDFCARYGFPYPSFSAYLSSYSQFIAGCLIAVGFLTRVAAAVMVINFVVALYMVHWNLPFSANIAPMAMLANSAYLALVGAPWVSVDAWWQRRTNTRTP